MGKPVKPAFDVQVFLAKVGAGKSILRFKKGQNVFVQGDRADTVFYIQRGRIKLTVLSITARKPWSAYWDLASFSVKAA
jgi:CRP/FNR family cyclic AMP-dependent transcriptional regulator